MDVTKDLEEKEGILTSFFRGNNLSILESIVRYLKDIRNLKFSHIAIFLNRDQRNIWTLYSRSKKKQEQFKPGSAVEYDDIIIPFSIFHDKKLCVLEAISEYLRDEAGFNYHKIGVLLSRDERNIWTVYHRAKKKRGIRKPNTSKINFRGKSG